MGLSRVFCERKTYYRGERARRGGSLVPGSAILLVLGVMTIVLLGVLALRRSVLFQSDIALSRVRVEQQFRLTEGILAWGIMRAKKNFNALIKHQDQTVTEDAGFWQLTGDAQSYRGKLLFVPSKTRTVMVTAQLYDAHSCVKSAHCSLAVDQPKKGPRRFRVIEYTEKS